MKKLLAALIALWPALAFAGTGTITVKDSNGSVQTFQVTTTGAGNFVQQSVLCDGAAAAQCATVTAANALKVDPSAVTQPVSGSVTVSGTVTANQGTSPWTGNVSQFGGNTVVTGTGASGAGIPRVTVASDSSVTANIGTTAGLALDTSVNGLLLGQGSATAGQKGPIVQCAVTAGAPTYTAGQTSPLSCDTAGDVRVTGGVLQGSTTSGQTGSLVMGAATTSAPAYLNGQTDPLSLTLLGSLRTAVSEPLPTGTNVIGGVTGSGTFTVQDLADGAVSPGIAGSKSLMTGCVFNTTPPTGTNGQQIGCQSDPRGGRITNIAQSNTAALTDKSGSITLGGTSQQADAAATTLRVYVIVENPCTAATQNVAATESLFVNFGAAANSGGSSFELGACGGLVMETGYVAQGTINVNAASTNHRYTIKVAEY